MSTSLMSRDRTEARKKGLLALSAWSGAGVLLALNWPITGAVAAGGAGYLTYKWFMFRAKRGMRF